MANKITTCPNCTYQRQEKDSVIPDWECPKCGVCYKKIISKKKEVKFIEKIMLIWKSVIAICLICSFLLMLGLSNAQYSIFIPILPLFYLYTLIKYPYTLTGQHYTSLFIITSAYIFVLTMIIVSSLKGSKILITLTIFFIALYFLWGIIVITSITGIPH